MKQIRKFIGGAFTILVLLTVAGVSQTMPASPAKVDSTKQNDGKAKSKEKKKTYIKDKVKDYQVFEGLFKIYQNQEDGSTYLEIDKSQLDKEFIYFNHVQDGVVGTFFFRGQYRGSKIFTIRKYFDKIEFVEENNDYYFDPENALYRAKDANISPAVLISMKIEATDSLESAYLVKADGLFLGEDVEMLKPAYPRTYQGYKLGRLNKDKSKLLSIRNYPENTDVVVEFVYEDPSPENSPGAGATDPRNISVRVQHSFIAVPQNDYRPRYDDPRVGFFMTQVTDLTSTSPTPYRDMIHRWHLKKKNPGQAISEPVEPIVWWIENTTPKELRSVIKKAVESWNIAFEAAGFKNAIVVKEQPDDAEWDAGDIRYNVLRWTSSPQPPFGGYGPSFVNPRTGQILGADVMLEYVFLTNRITYGKVFDTALLETEATPNFLQEAFDHQQCIVGNYLQVNNLFGLLGNSALGKSIKENKQLVEESIYYLLLHEVGHTLGLNHNMKASQLNDLATLNERSVTEKIGLTGSVMDYPAINFANNKYKQGQYYTTRPGPYDIWAIQFAYSPELGNAKKRETHLARSTEHQLAFGNDADDMRSAGKALDPRINTGDLSSDAIGFALGQIELSKTVTNRLLTRVVEKNHSYQMVRNAYMITTGQHANSLRVISRYIGGVYVDRAFAGQPGATKPFIPVPGREQKRAMAALAKHAFAPEAFDVSNEIYQYLQAQRRGFNHANSPEDLRIHARVLAVQKSVLDHLLHPNVLQRMSDTELYGNEYPLAEMMDDLTAAIFDADKNSSVNSFRKGLQVEYVNRLLKIMGEEGKSNYDHIAKGLAYYHLKNIHKLATTANSPDTGTAAHRAYLAGMIEAQLREM
jgi:hypothetical protein